MSICAAPQMGWLLCSAALALTLITHTAAHRHSAVPSSRFQILMFNILLSKAVVRTRTTMFFVRPPSLTAAWDRL